MAVWGGRGEGAGKWLMVPYDGMSDGSMKIHGALKYTDEGDIVCIGAPDFMS